MQVLSIEEKPEHPKSNYAMVGLYMLDNRASAFAKQVVPSARGEIEIKDVINQYLAAGQLQVSLLKGIWEDAGTFESLHRVSAYFAEKAAREAAPQVT
jgi:glucose-1-phosphate thymidylyltransferase